MTDGRRKLLRLIQRHCVEIALPGTYFDLPDDGRTTEYLNIKRACMNRNVHGLLARELAVELAHFEQVGAVAGIVLGGCHLASILAAHAFHNVLLVRKTPKEHGRTPGFIEGYIKKGERVVLLDDIVAAGKTAVSAAGRLRDAGLDVRGAIAVIDKRRDKTATLSDGTELRALFTEAELVYDGKDPMTGEPLQE